MSRETMLNIIPILFLPPEFTFNVEILRIRQEINIEEIDIYTFSK